MAAPQFYTGMSYSQLIQLLQASIAPNGVLTAPLTIDQSDGVTAGTTFGASGNVNIAAPSSGIGLSVNAATGNTALAVNHSRNIGGVPVRFQETGFDDVGWEFQRGSSTQIDTIAINRAGLLYANHWHVALSHTFLAGVSSTTALTVGSSGNITVAAPSSGTALTVNTTSDNQLSLNATAGQYSTINFQNTGVNKALVEWDQTNSNMFIGTVVSSAITFYTNTTPRMQITASGNVTIAAPSSGTALTVNTTSDNQLSLNATAGQYSTINFQNTGVNKALVEWDQTNSNMFIGTVVSSAITFYTNTTPRMQITASGNVTIAAPSSGVPLTVSVNTGVFIGQNWTDGTITGQTILGSGYFQFGSLTNHGLLLFTNNSTRMTCTNTGNWNIDAPSSGDTLTVAPSVTTGALIATSAALTSGAGAAAGTLTNAPSAGNPTKWIKINDNGTIRSIPAW
jgi:hypothetical protein